MAVFLRLPSTQAGFGGADVISDLDHVALSLCEDITYTSVEVKTICF